MAQLYVGYVASGGYKVVRELRNAILGNAAKAVQELVDLFGDHEAGALI